MKNIFKIIFVNILLICLVLLLTESGLFLLSFFNNLSKNLTLSEIFKNTLYEYEARSDYIYLKDYDRQVYGSQYKNKNIAVFGCSFAYGAGLEDEQTFGAKLSKLTKDTVFNLASCGGSPKNMLWLFRDRKILDKILNNKNIDYVLYLYIPDHRRRLYIDAQTNPPILEYTRTDDDITYQKRKILFKPKILSAYENLVIEKTIKQDDYNEMINFYFKVIQREMKDYFKNQKHQPQFIILKYPYNNNTDNLEELEKDGIKIISIKDIVDVNLQDSEYQISENDSHPNEKAWDVIVPALVKKIKI